MVRNKTFSIEVGSQVYLQPTGNLASMHYQPRWGEVVKIARKYFYVDVNGLQEKFLRDTFQNINEDCNSAWVVWESAAAYEDWKVREGKLRDIKAYFQRIYDSRETDPSSIDRAYDLIFEIRP